MYRVNKTTIVNESSKTEMVYEDKSWFPAATLFYGFFYNTNASVIEKKEKSFTIQVTSNESWKYEIIEVA